MTLKLERWWPYIASIIWVAVWYFALSQRFPSHPAGLLGATGTAAAVLVGFLTTANAILLSLVNTEIFKRLAAADYTTLFYTYFYEAIAAAMAFLVISVIGFFLSDADASTGAFPIIWMVFAGLSFFLFVRINHLLFSLVRHAK